MNTGDLLKVINATIDVRHQLNTTDPETIAQYHQLIQAEFNRIAVVRCAFEDTVEVLEEMQNAAWSPLYRDLFLPNGHERFVSKGLVGYCVLSRIGTNPHFTDLKFYSSIPRHQRHFLPETREEARLTECNWYAREETFNLR